MDASAQPAQPAEAFSGIAAQAAAFRRGDACPLATTEALLARIATLNPQLQAYLTVTAEAALAQARQARDDLARGIDRGALQGVAIGIKDLIDMAGVPTSWGGVLWPQPAAADASVVQRLRTAGAVLPGKLHLTEGAFAQHHPALPTPLNPWGEALWPGSSSSGSGVATAAGLCAAALGTDTGGSIRFPSGACGLTGLKPTWGRVSRHGVRPLAESLDHIGPMARSVEDAALLLQAIAGPDVADPTTLDAPLPDLSPALRQAEAEGLQGLVIGLAPAWTGAVNDAATTRVLAQAAQQLQALGATLVELAMPPGSLSMVKGWETLCAVETAAAHAATYPAFARHYGPVLSELIALGRRVPAPRVAALQAQRAVFAGRMRRLLAQVDALLLPVHPFGCPRLDALDSLVGSDGGVDDMMRCTAPFDLSGQPTLTLPAGCDDGGAPIGVQLAARAEGEPMLVRIGHAFQQATAWHLRRPPV